MAATQLDDVDRRIIEVLRTDGRISMRALAEAVHISRANAYARYGQLLDAGVIRGIRAEIDPVQCGFGTSAYVTVNVRQADWVELRARLSALPGVEHLALVGGDYDVIMLVRARDNEDLRHLVLDNIQGMDGVTSTRTHLIFDEPEADVPLLGPRDQR